MLIELIITNWIDFAVLTVIQFGNATLGWCEGSSTCTHVDKPCAS